MGVAKKNQKRFLKAFKKEWKNGAGPNGVSLRKAANAAEAGAQGYDAAPAVGEIRLLADFDEPVAVAVLEDLGDKYLVMPLSEFSAPATDGEILVGSRVFQAWNMFKAPKDFIAHGWQMETLGKDALEDLLEMRKAMASGKALSPDLAQCVGAKVTAVNDFRCQYLRGCALESEAGLARLIPMANILPRRSAWGITWKVTRIAASIALLVAVAVPTVSYFARDDYGMMGAVRRAVWGDSSGGYYSGRYSRNYDCCAQKESDRFESLQGCAQFGSSEGGGYSSGRGYSSVPRIPSPRFGAVTAPMQDVEGYERYADFKENKFFDPKTSPLSTFGLDVDTASYTTMRRYVTDRRRLPPKDSVRLEEYVNYFNYNYEGPTGEDPVAVHCELSSCPWNEKHNLLRVGVQAKRLDAASVPPCNLVFLIDCSGSMGGWNGEGPLDTAKQALLLLTRQLRPQDSVAIVTYASGVDVRLPATPGSQKERIEAALNSLRAGGATSGGAGLELAYTEAMKNFSKTANNRVILITDGDFNVGIGSPAEVERYIEKKRDTGVFLTVLGVGRGNYQDATMKKLANAGNGNYGFIDGILEAKKVFLREFGGSMTTVAKDVKLQLEFNPAAVAAYRLLGYESRHLEARDFNDDKKDAGEMGAGHSMTALYEIVPVGADDDGALGSVDALKYQKRENVESGDLLTVKLRYKQPDGDTSKKLEFAVKAEKAAKPSESFVFASAVAEAALILRDSEFKGSASWESVLDRARSAKGADEEGYRAEFIRLMEIAEMSSSGLQRDRDAYDSDDSYSTWKGNHGRGDRESWKASGL